MQDYRSVNLQFIRPLNFFERHQIFCDAPIEIDWEETDIDRTDLAKVGAVLKKFEFNSLVKRLPKHMQEVPEQGALYFEANNLVTLKEIEWPDELQIDGPIVLHIIDDELWLSLDRSTVMHKKVAMIERSAWRVFV